MPITVEELRKAFAPAVAVQKSDEVEIDLGSVSDALIADMSKIASIGESDDPAEAVAGLSASVESVEALLEKCSEDESGRVVAKTTSDDAMAKRFDAKKTQPTKTKKADESPADADLDLRDEMAEKEWGHDLAPSASPVRREERMTKRERPVSARRGAAKDTEKYQRARERALGGGERSWIA